MTSTEIGHTTVAMAPDGDAFGMVDHSRLHASRGYSIPLHRQVPPSFTEATSKADVHAYVQSHVARIIAKYDRHFDLFEQTAGVKHGFDKRTQERRVHEGVPGRLPLSVVQDGVVWVGLVEIGTGPGRVERTATFDTGSVDLILHPGQYDPSTSTTAERTGETFSLVYGDGSSANGEVILDSVTVAGLEARNVAIGNALESTIGGDCQAIVGMASMMMPLSMAALRRPGLMTALMEQGAIRRNVFGLGLWRDGSAHLDLGHIPSQYRGKISWTPIFSPEDGMWACYFGISGLPQTQIALVDTGTSLIIGPKELVRHVMTVAGLQVTEVGDSIRGVYRSDGPTPYIPLIIAGRTFVLSAESLAFRQYDQMTVAGIVGKPDRHYWLLGDAFLQNVYAVFDADHKRMGFAPRQPNPAA
ncbi:hypothetical protein V8E36_009358 [Tilletia maclaganii]